MRIVFLDIDGVLNTVYTKEYFEGCIGIDDKNLKAVAHFIEESNKVEETKIVLSSSWRMGINKDGQEIPNSYKYLTRKLNSVGLSIYDETPILNKNMGVSQRGKEIATWILTHMERGDAGAYVILDDQVFPDFKKYGLMKNYVQTSWGHSNGGFTQKHERKALEVLYKAEERWQESLKVLPNVTAVMKAQQITNEQICALNDLRRELYGEKPIPEDDTDYEYINKIIAVVRQGKKE